MKFHDPDFALLCHLLPDRPLCLDVGVNAGQSIRSIKAARPGAVNLPAQAEILEVEGAR